LTSNYTHIGEDAQEKAIAAISGNFERSSETDSEKINKALSFIDNLETKTEAILKIEKILH
jgi:hypothetical protein